MKRCNRIDINLATNDLESGCICILEV